MYVWIKINVNNKMSEKDLHRRIHAAMKDDPYLAEVSRSWSVGWKEDVLRVEVVTNDPFRGLKRPNVFVGEIIEKGRQMERDERDWNEE